MFDLKCKDHIDDPRQTPSSLPLRQDGQTAKVPLCEQLFGLFDQGLERSQKRRPGRPIDHAMID